MICPLSDTEFKAMDNKKAVKKNNKPSLPPKRGQIKAKILEEFVESLETVVVTVIRPGQATKKSSEKGYASTATAAAAAVK
ncbi:hypothetical protein ACOSQ3_033250 [Xanthoceras sorbifolium]